MTQTIATTEILPIVLQMSPAFEMTDDQFFDFCQLNRDLSFERTAEGELIIVPPTGGITGNHNFNLAGQFWSWVERDGTGIAFDSSTGFKLPNGANRSPDISLLRLSRWNVLSVEQQEKFIPLCPDFVVEIRSPSDSLQFLKKKLQEYIDNGALLGWLIDRKNRCVYVYRPGVEVERLERPAVISGEPVLSGLNLNLENIW
ncbi:MAG: Uma2 family endonuclease [Cyanosarcina radialis HA8281-LM2]|jgi:Uma2 family endonuclease|nr:Uma2 family endonuclease [Cyanosarcina radialis HA8281-LM2]